MMEVVVTSGTKFELRLSFLLYKLLSILKLAQQKYEEK